MMDMVQNERNEARERVGVKEARVVFRLSRRFFLCYACVTMQIRRCDWLRAINIHGRAWLGTGQSASRVIHQLLRRTFFYSLSR